MSPRAALRLERLGYGPVYDYAAGKTDWAASGLPTEGALASILRSGDAVEDPPVCDPSDLVDEVARRPSVRGAEMCVVLSPQRIVLGQLRGRDLMEAPRVAAERIMDPGPVTTRADEPLDDLVERMHRHDVERMLVTSPAAELIGLVRRDAAEAVLERRARAGRS